jgi:NTE family protein
VSPYVNPVAGWGRRQLRHVLERNVAFEDIPDLADGDDVPRLVVGTVDVNGGDFETFEGGEITPKVMLATAAIPELFEAVEMDGHWHWDGLFSQNPPVEDLTFAPPERKPHELWVLQINPQTRDGEPKSLTDIADRRNELSGNISLNQELRFIDTINDWVDNGTLPESEFNHIDYDRIQLRETYGVDSKLDRSPEFVEDLMEQGVERADEFLEGLGRPRTETGG